MKTHFFIMLLIICASLVLLQGGGGFFSYARLKKREIGVERLGLDIDLLIDSYLIYIPFPLHTCDQ